MSVSIENRGNAVKINNHIIPAINIQVDGVPGWLNCKVVGCEIVTHWYGIYFEIMFEDGSLWEVNHKSTEFSDDKIYVYVWTKWAYDHLCADDFLQPFTSWEDFLFYYDAYRQAGCNDYAALKETLVLL